MTIQPSKVQHIAQTMLLAVAIAFVFIVPTLKAKDRPQAANADPSQAVAGIVSEVQTFEKGEGMFLSDEVRQELLTSDIVVRDVPSGKSKKIVKGGLSPAWSADGTRIAFLVFPTETLLGGRSADYRQLEVINADGSGRKRVKTVPHGIIGGFFWSPAGDSIAYVEHSYNGWVQGPSTGHHLSMVPAINGARIVLVNPENGNRTELPPLNLGCASASPSWQWLVVASRLAWSPDGSAIAFTHCGTNLKPVVAVARIGGSTQDIIEGYDPLWSPDGKRLLFLRDSGGPIRPASIWVSNTDGSAPNVVLQNESAEFGRAWFPDGRSIAFGSRRDSKKGSEIFRINVDGTGMEKIVSDRGYFLWSPVIAPQGNALAFNQAAPPADNVRNSDFSIRIVDLENHSETKLANGQLGGIVWQK